MGFIGQISAPGPPGHADHRAEIHQRLIEIEHLLTRQQTRGQVPEPSFRGMAAWVTPTDEDPKQDTGHVGVDDRCALAEREALNRADGVVAQALEGPQRGLVRRELTIVVGDDLAGDGV